MSKLVTIEQAKALRNLGFDEPTARWAYENFLVDDFELRSEEVYAKRNKLQRSLSVPTVDEAIDWLRRKFHVMVYDTTEPYVDPIDKHIRYAYRVKHCNTKWGWNQREYIGCSKWSKDSYAAKRMAIWIAIRYIIKTKKNAKRRRNNKTRRKGIQSNSSNTRRATMLKMWNQKLL